MTRRFLNEYPGLPVAFRDRQRVSCEGVAFRRRAEAAFPVQ